MVGNHTEPGGPGGAAGVLLVWLDLAGFDGLLNAVDLIPGTFLAFAQSSRVNPGRISGHNPVSTAFSNLVDLIGD